MSLRCEVVQLRSLLGARRRGSEIVGHAAVDALYLAQQWYLGQGTGRVEARQTGMSKRRWQWAVAYLRYAGVVSTRTGDWRYGLQWVAKDIGDAMQRIKDADGVEIWQLRAVRRQV